MDKTLINLFKPLPLLTQKEFVLYKINMSNLRTSYELKNWYPQYLTPIQDIDCTTYIRVLTTVKNFQPFPLFFFESRTNHIFLVFRITYEHKGKEYGGFYFQKAHVSEKKHISFLFSESYYFVLPITENEKRYCYTIAPPDILDFDRGMMSLCVYLLTNLPLSNFSTLNDRIFQYDIETEEISLDKNSLQYCLHMATSSQTGSIPPQMTANLKMKEEEKSVRIRIKATLDR